MPTNYQVAKKFRNDLLLIQRLLREFHRHVPENSIEDDIIAKIRGHFLSVCVLIGELLHHLRKEL